MDKKKSTMFEMKQNTFVFFLFFICHKQSTFVKQRFQDLLKRIGVCFIMKPDSLKKVPEMSTYTKNVNKSLISN